MSLIKPFAFHSFPCLSSPQMSHLTQSIHFLYGAYSSIFVLAALSFPAATEHHDRHSPSHPSPFLLLCSLATATRLCDLMVGAARNPTGFGATLPGPPSA